MHFSMFFFFSFFSLRSELCEEFNAMLVEVEGNWEARLREEKEEAERLAEFFFF